MWINVCGFTHTWCGGTYIQFANMSDDATIICWENLHVMSLYEGHFVKDCKCVCCVFCCYVCECILMHVCATCVQLTRVENWRHYACDVHECILVCGNMHACARCGTCRWCTVHTFHMMSSVVLTRIPLNAHPIVCDLCVVPCCRNSTYCCIHVFDACVMHVYMLVRRLIVMFLHVWWAHMHSCVMCAYSRVWMNLNLLPTVVYTWCGCIFMQLCGCIHTLWRNNVAVCRSVSWFDDWLRRLHFETYITDCVENWWLHWRCIVGSDWPTCVCACCAHTTHINIGNTRQYKHGHNKQQQHTQLNRYFDPHWPQHVCAHCACTHNTHINIDNMCWQVNSHELLHTNTYYINNMYVSWGTIWPTTTNTTRSQHNARGQFKDIRLVGFSVTGRPCNKHTTLVIVSNVSLGTCENVNTMATCLSNTTQSIVK